MSLDKPDQHPAIVRPYVAALGRKGAMQFIEKFGGAFVYFSEASTQANAAAAMVGASRFDALRKEFSIRQLGNGNVKVPLASKWLAIELDRDGFSKSQIARRLRIDVATVRQHINGTVKTSPDKTSPDKTGADKTGEAE